MNKSMKKWFIAATSLVGLGLVTFFVAMAENQWDLTKTSTDNYETVTHEITEPFGNISINTQTDDIVFASSDDSKCSVVCYENSKIKHSVSVSNNTLHIEVIDSRKWYDHITFNILSSKITIYLPSEKYNSLMIKESTGNIEIPNNFKVENIEISASTGNVKCCVSESKTVKIKLSTGNITLQDIRSEKAELTTTTGHINVTGASCDDTLKIATTTGKTTLTDITCKDIISTGSTGAAELKNLIASETLCVERTTGSIRFDGCDADDITMKTTTGKIDGTVISEKIFVTESSTGNISVPQSSSGGKFNAKTTTGNIKIDIKK